MVYAGGIVAVALALLRASRLFVEMLDVAKFNEAMGKLLRAGNRDRARKLANAVPKAIYGYVARALIERSFELQADDGRGMVTDALRERLHQELEQQTRRMQRWDWLSVLAALAAGVAALGPADEVSAEASIGIPAVAAVLILWAWFRTRRELKVSKRGGEELVELLAAYVVDHPDETATRAR